MSNTNLYQDGVNRLGAQADSMGQLAKDAGAFAAVVAAFESRDANAFRWVLNRLELIPRCELICHWVETKLGVLRCLRVCGPPRGTAETPDLLQFARAMFDRE